MARYTRAVLAAASLLALAAPSQAQHEHAQKLQGTWVRMAEGCKVKLEVKPDHLRCTMTTEEGMAISVDADYVVSKDGILLGLLRTPVAPNAADVDAVDRRLFHFLFSAEDRSLTIKDVCYKDSHDGDKMKGVLEGKYHRTEAKHARGGSPLDRLTMPTMGYLQHPPAYCAPDPDLDPAKLWTEPKGNEPARRTGEPANSSGDIRSGLR
jgi:hypothetical protein